MQDFFVDANDARKYVLSFWRFMSEGKRPTFIETQTRRINFYDMTDEEAIDCANMLKALELEGGK